MKRFTLLGMSALVASTAASASTEFDEAAVAAMIGDIVIEAPWAVAREGEPIKVYMTIHNAGEADAIVSAISATGKTVKFLEKGDDGYADMEDVSIPGGDALMFDQFDRYIEVSDLQAPVEGGDILPMTLEFEEAGKLELEISVAVLQ